MSLVALVVGDAGWAAVGDDLTETGTDLDSLTALDARSSPRWVVWDQRTALRLAHSGIALARTWDLAAVHRLLAGGWQAEPALVWAALHDLDPATVPTLRPPDLFDLQEPDDRHTPVGDDGHLRPDWIAGGWDRADRLVPWARVALELAHRQLDQVTVVSTAHSESTAEVLCAELTVHGLPVDRDVAEELIASVIGPRPRDEAEARFLRAERDVPVLATVPHAGPVDLRSPGQVRALLRGVGIEVPDTRAWRLEPLRDRHPLVPALLTWRKAERMATTYGYSWLDSAVDPDGRLRGEWSASDGAAGRMTASSGLHNLPAEMRRAVLAEPGYAFVRADLGQIEPRILAAVSGDNALIAATAADDMYASVAIALGVDRATAKVAVLGAMYGQTTGHGAQALTGLRSAYPVAIDYLEQADRAAQGAHDLRTFGGRRIVMAAANANSVPDRVLRSQAAARGRYGRNAMVQGAAAEFFKVWALTVRARAAGHGARIVLCLHDELLVHVPVDEAERVAALVDECVGEAAARWSPRPDVRFLADTSVVSCWADAK